jgi:hypothetical protein
MGFLKYKKIFKIDDVAETWQFFLYILLSKHLFPLENAIINNPAIKMILNV